MRDNPDNAPEKKAEYKIKLSGMSAVELYKETKDKIWLSAFANNNPRSCYHWQVDYTYDEWEKRGDLNEYSRAHAEVVKENA